MVVDGLGGGGGEFSFSEGGGETRLERKTRLQSCRCAASGLPLARIGSDTRNAVAV